VEDAQVAAWAEIESALAAELLSGNVILAQARPNCASARSRRYLTILSGW
jgi:hypothetical protein